MKKYFWVYAFAALLMGGFVASCSDDDPEIEVPEKPETKPEEKPEEKPVVCPIATTTFSGVKGLSLTYSGQPLLGKQVVFTPNKENATKATLVLSGVVPSSKGMDLNLPSSGIVPGETTTTLNIDLKIDGETVSFEGKEENESRAIAYKGQATKDVLTLELTVSMHENALTNKKFAPVAVVERDSLNTAGQSPLTLQWLSTSTIPFLGNPANDINNLLVLAQSFPIVPVTEKEKVTIGKALELILQDVTFLADGNIQATYKDSLTDNQWKTSPLNMATYTVESENKMRVFINADQIMAFEQSKASRAGVADLVTVLMAKASELLVKGVVVTFEEKNGVMQFYLDKETMLPILNVLVPFLKDEQFYKEVTAMLGGILGPQMMPIIEQLALPILKAMPGVIEGTTSMHFGLNMTAAK